MSALAEHVDRLETWLRRDGTAPAWRAVLLVEAKDITWGAVSLIPQSAIHSIIEYGARFDSLLAKGHAWLNLSAVGVLAEELVVCVEVPRDAVGAYGRTSVNLSGPSLNAAGGKVWDVLERRQIA